jgi:hypothetical protein
MSKMKALDLRLDEIEGKMDGLLHLMSDMVKMEAQIKDMEEELRGRLDKLLAAQVDSGKLVDRLIEMSLVASGHGDQANVHRAQARLEQNSFSNAQTWEDDEPEEDAWPPPDSDCMDVVG